MPQPVLELAEPLGQALGLRREGVVLAGQLTGRLEIAADRRPLLVGALDRGQLGVPLVEPLGQPLVGVDVGVGEPHLELGVLSEQRGHRVEHRHRRTSCSPGPSSVPRVARGPCMRNAGPGDGAGVAVDYLLSALPAPAVFLA